MNILLVKLGRHKCIIGNLLFSTNLSKESKLLMVKGEVASASYN